MKLLTFIYSMSSGGAERVTANLANYWAGEGWDVTIVTLAPISDDFYEFHPTVKRVALELAGDSRNVLIGLAKNLHRLFVLRRVIRASRPDVALGMMTGANVLVALAVWGLPAVRAIGSERIHPPYLPLGGLWEWLRRYTYGFLAAVVAQTHESADWIATNTTARRVRVVPNPAVWPLPTHEPCLEPASVCSSGRNLLLAVGRLSDQKQFKLLIASFQSLARLHSRWDLVVLGDGPLRGELQTQLVSAGMENRIFFPGRAGNIGQWYEHADLYVLTSRFEGFPNSLVEAMAYGLPSVSFDCDTGPRDIIRHGIDGFLVPSGDQLALTSALNRLMGDATLREQFALRALEVRDRFSMERIAGMWELLFNEAG